MDEPAELPTTEELEHLAERLLNEYSNPSNTLGDDLMITIGAIHECISLRKGINHAIEKCTDLEIVEYLRKLIDKTNQHYVVIGDAELEE